MTMDPKIARALRAARPGYEDGGDVEDKRSMIRKAYETGMDYAGRGLATADLYSGGMLSAVAGLNPFTSYERVMAARDKALESVPREAKALATEPINPMAAIFAGPMARTANKAMLRRAEELAARNAPREQIWNETGWFKGVDGKWRFEIDDSAARMGEFYTEPNHSAVVRAHVPQKPGEYVPQALDLENYISHPELARAYWPTREQAPSVIFEDLGPLTRGRYSRPDDMVVMNSSSFLAKDEGKSSALHELQHRLQYDEGFALGYNPIEAGHDVARARFLEDDFRSRMDRIQNAHSDDARVLLSRAERGDPDAAKMVEEAKSKWYAKLGQKTDDNPFGVEPYEAVAFELSERDETLKRLGQQYNEAFKLSKRDPHDVYKAHAGEVEARTVQKRMDLTPEQRRARAPWLDYDVPEADQIVRFK